MSDCKDKTTPLEQGVMLDNQDGEGDARRKPDRLINAGATLIFLPYGKLVDVMKSFHAFGTHGAK